MVFSSVRHFKKVCDQKHSKKHAVVLTCFELHQLALEIQTHYEKLEQLSHGIALCAGCV